MSQPSFTEARQAALLAQCIRARRSDPSPAHTENWDKLEADVQETLAVFRPELGPGPRADLLDDIFAEIETGPFAIAPTDAEHAAAHRLADALDEDSLDDDLDDDVLEALLALRPDLAAPPSVDIDDILAGVRTGPFAPVLRITGELPSSVARTTQLPTPRTGPPVAAPPPARRLPRWWGPVGLAVAAAAALVVVVPGLSLNEPMPTSLSSQVEQAAPKQAAKPAAASSERQAYDRAPAAESAPPREAASDAPSPEEPPSDAAGARAPSAPSAEPKSVSPERKEGPAPETEPLIDGASWAAPPPPPPMASNTAAPSGRSVDDIASLGYVQNTGDAMLEAQAEEDVDDAESYDERAQFADESVPAKAKKAEAVLEEAERAIADIYPAPAPASAAGGASVDATITRESRAATSSRARPRRDAPAAAAPAMAEEAPAPPRLGLLAPALQELHPELVGPWLRAEQARRSGDRAGAAQQLSAIASQSNDPDVRVDAAVRAGQLWLAEGAIERAREQLRFADSVEPTFSILRTARDDLRHRIESDTQLEPE